MDWLRRNGATWSHLARQGRRAVVLAVAVLIPGTAWAQMWGLSPKSVEIAQLPTFCWSQMGVPNAKGPEYRLPGNCGPNTNHYCPGLVHLIRAKKATKKSDRTRQLLDADTAVRYTENGIRQYPSCSIRSHLEATKTEVKSLMAMYGVRRPPKTED